MSRSLVRWCNLFVLLLTAAAPAYAWRMSAWVPAWDSNALPIMQTRAGALDEANPGWYTVGIDGSVVKNWGAEDPSMRAALTGTALVPTIKNYINGRFDGNAVATLLASPTTRETHVNAIANLVAQQAFDGIDIDYERVPTTSRADFTAFVELLASKLHANGKLLSVTVVAKTTDAENWNGPGAQDWIAIGRVADSVKIMGYDYHWSTSAAGPLAPLSWLDEVATYAEAVIPSGKSILGLPWYGYDWMGTSGATVTYTDAMALAAANGAEITHDANGEATFTYAGRTVFFQDATSYLIKTNHIAAAHPRLGGFAAWRVGAEDPAIWSLVSQLKRSMSSAATPASEDFAINGPAGIQMRAGAIATAKFGLVPINGFNQVAEVEVEKLDNFPGTILLSSTALRVGSTITMTLTTPTTTAAGLYRVLLRMKSGDVSHEQTISIAVEAAPVTGDFRIETPSRVTLPRGSRADFPLFIVGQNGFNAAATITTRFLDNGFIGNVAIDKATVISATPLNVAVAAGTSTPSGTYRLEVTATSGTLVHTNIVEVLVTGAKTRAVGRR